MKRYSLLIFALCLTFQTFATVTHVTTKEELYSALCACSITDTIYIDNDIDINGMSRYTSTFVGVLDGQGHTLSNFTFCDDDTDHAAMLCHVGNNFANRAVIRNLTLENFHIEGDEYVACLAGNANYALFENIHVILNSYRIYCDDQYCGAIAGKANDCNFIKCQTSGTKNIYACASWYEDGAYCGGLAGYSRDCLFYRCVNRVGVYSNSDYTGGICGVIADGSVHSCVNEGTVSSNYKTTFGANTETGGITGIMIDGSIRSTINTGYVDSDDDGVNAILGRNFDTDWALTVIDGTIMRCRNPNKFSTNYYLNTQWSTASKITSYVSSDVLLSGQICYSQNEHQTTDFWRQTISTGYPEPLGDGDMVYSNILCYGTQSYSNKYNSTAAHDPIADDIGNCVYCGNNVGHLTGSMHITNASELCELSKAINVGGGYSDVTIYLDNDIDMSGCDFDPIGTKTNPYKGIFDGQGHRIKNLTMTRDEGYTGFFGCVISVDGLKETYIKNLIIDSSCSITSTSGSGVAGLIGCVESFSGTFCDVILQNCGNEATVTGVKNVSGLLGGIYANDETYLTMTNCYNSGAINGESESATLCAYARRDYTFTNCYNSGTLTGGDGSHQLFRFKSTADYEIRKADNCYDVNGTQGRGQNGIDRDVVTQITADQVRLGYLCNKLNSSSKIYSQNLESDTHPVPGSAGLKYTRSMTNKWGTIVLPFDLTTSDDDNYSLYNVTAVADTTLCLTQIEGTLSAGTPAIICMDDAAMDSTTTAYELSITPGTTISTTLNNPTTAVAGLTLTGVYEKTDISDLSGYKLSGGYFKNIANLENYEDSVHYCEPFHAYLAGSLSSNADMLSLEAMPDTMIIRDAEGLIALATSVNSGAADFSNTIVVLDCDIDMNGYSLTPIGTSTYPYKGTFDGQGHRIKNLTLSTKTAYSGTFGCVAGTNTVIKNLVIDKSCSFTCTKSGSAAIIGAISSISGSVCKVTIQNCGNEANVTGAKNTGSILGAVYNNNNTQLIIENCYNSGDVYGTSDCGDFIGYARRNFTITNCYNTGALLGGGDGTLYFLRPGTAGTQVISNCYDINAAYGDNVALLDTLDLNTGMLCENLNANRGDYAQWTQKLEDENTHPTFGDSSISYTRNIDEQWSTIVLPYDVTIDVNEPYDFYEITAVKDSTITLGKISGTLAAGTPCVLRMSAAALNSETSKYEYTWAANGDISTTIVELDQIKHLNLTGTFVTTDITLAVGYILKDNNFKLLSDLMVEGETTVCPAFNAYILGTPITVGGTVDILNNLYLNVDEDETTNVGDVLSTLNSLQSADIYDLNGRKRNDLQDGVNIIRNNNGITMKVIIK